jgi:hypothetical protein
VKLTRVTEQNLAYCVQLAKELVDAAQFTVPFDWDFATTQGRTSVQRTDCYNCMAMHGDDYTGMVLGHVTHLYFSPALIGVEDAWFVRPGSPDRTRTASALMRGFVAWCRDRGAIAVQTADTASIAPLSVDRLYRHLGFKRYGSVYNYTIGVEQCGQQADNAIT